MATEEISARDLREKQANILNQIEFKGANFIITRHGKKSAVLISLEEFQLLQKTMEYLEDKSDVADAKKAPPSKGSDQALGCGHLELEDEGRPIFHYFPL